MTQFSLERHPKAEKPGQHGRWHSDEKVAAEARALLDDIATSSLQEGKYTTAQIENAKHYFNEDWPAFVRDQSAVFKAHHTTESTVPYDSGTNPNPERGESKAPWEGHGVAGEPVTW